MPYFRYVPIGGISFYWEVPSEKGVWEVDDAATTASCVDDGNAVSMSGDKGETSSSSSSYKTEYEKLPYSLKSCLDYCSFLSDVVDYCSFLSDNAWFGAWRMRKERLVRLMVAEGLIEDKAGETDAFSLEDIASSIINELVSLGMLNGANFLSPSLKVPKQYYSLCIVDGNKKDFDARNVDSPIRVLRCPDSIDAEIFNLFENLPIQSLYLFCGHDKLSQAMTDTICRLRSLLVLDVTGGGDVSLNELVGHVNLRHLFLAFNGSRYILPTLGDFPHLQTLDTCFFPVVLPEKVSHLKTLRHLHSVDAKCENIGELGSLTQLRSLSVHVVNHENIDELFKAIMSMENLTSLSMEAESFDCGREWIDVFPLLEPFTPPPLLQELLLRGTLIELPIWIADLKNLVYLALIGSQLSEIPSNILQNLPALKHLFLHDAFKAKLVGEDFFSANGFPRLEILVIISHHLIEWTRLAAEGFPCLKSLRFEFCPELMFLPEGLQNIFTLQELIIRPAHTDLIRRLKGDENYKIKHIPCVQIWEKIWKKDMIYSLKVSQM